MEPNTEISDNCIPLQSVVSSTFWTKEELASTDFAKIASGLIDVNLNIFLN